jgi:hypothetical protein
MIVNYESDGCCRKWLGITFKFHNIRVKVLWKSMKTCQYDHTPIEILRGVTQMQVRFSTIVKCSAGRQYQVSWKSIHYLKNY